MTTTHNPITLPYDLGGGWTVADVQRASDNAQRGYAAPGVDVLFQRIAKVMASTNPTRMDEPADIGSVVYAKVTHGGTTRRLLKFSDTRTRSWIDNWGNRYKWDELIDPSLD